MSRYYIDCVLTSDQRAALIDADVDFGEVSVGTATFHRHGVVFSEDTYEEALDVLGLFVDPRRELHYLETPQGRRVPDTLELPLLAMPTGSNPVVWAGNRRQEWRYVQDTFGWQQPEIGLGVVLHMTNDPFTTTYRHIAGVLVVNLYGVPEEADDYSEHRDDRFGYRLDLGVLGDEYQIIRDDEQKPLAIFRGDSIGGSLWLLFWPEGQYAPEFLNYVLHFVCRLLHPGLGSVLPYEEYRRIAARLRWISYAHQLVLEEEVDIDRRINLIGESVEEARQQLVGVLRELAAANRRRGELASLSHEERLRQFTDRLSTDFDNLTASGDFESLDFEERQIVAVTRPILIRHGDLIYEMGRYRISIGTEYGLILTSHDGVYADGHCHPHISDRGNACFGNATESVAKLQASMSYGALLPFLVRYLEDGYTPEDSYVMIDAFNVPTRSQEEADGSANQQPRRRRARTGRGNTS